ncbi:hypothetical protein QVD17_30617 [Tagetes erecta]|uniref:Uncharacterized protein n=1 Tax=Tagetes erecta TaxID=13708 RepID=A0AAD8NNE0_TARER|nr:hypothetical protein QVD17_30617 [Tagetes erecta]
MPATSSSTHILQLQPLPATNLGEIGSKRKRLNMLSKRKRFNIKRIHSYGNIGGCFCVSIFHPRCLKHSITADACDFEIECVCVYETAECGGFVALGGVGGVKLDHKTAAHTTVVAAAVSSDL